MPLIPKFFACGGPFPPLKPHFRAPKSQKKSPAARVSPSKSCFSCPQIPKNFACGARFPPQNRVFRVPNPQNFRLRRTFPPSKSRFRASIFPKFSATARFPPHIAQILKSVPLIRAPQPVRAPIRAPNPCPCDTKSVPLSKIWVRAPKSVPLAQIWVRAPNPCPPQWSVPLSQNPIRAPPMLWTKIRAPNPCPPMVLEIR